MKLIFLINLSGDSDDGDGETGKYHEGNDKTINDVGEKLSALKLNIFFKSLDF